MLDASERQNFFFLILFILEGARERPLSSRAHLYLER